MTGAIAGAYCGPDAIRSGLKGADRLIDQLHDVAEPGSCEVKPLMDLAAEMHAAATAGAGAAVAVAAAARARL